ncbi:HNH endonuclease [Cupriavidus sp. WS]|uniref:HNH endonuclease n=1 Tax=Cupriavidus sp. WS TaxID=1312922 RepID=UPI000369038C|nr:HNH endonuclease [Cupriavidus sp. WS]
MTARPPSICRQPGCGITIARPGYCTAHARPAGGWAPDAERGTRHQRGYDAEWERIRARILKRARGLCECAECRALDRVRVAKEVDHIVPKAQGGTDDDDNLQAINRDCHKAKTLRERTPPRSAAPTVAEQGRWVGGAWVMRVAHAPRRR